MSVAKARLTATITKFGDAFTVGATPGVGLFSLLSGSSAESFLSEADITSAGKPIYQAIVSADDVTEAADIVSWNGVSLTVQIVVPYRYRGVTMAKRLVLT